MENLRKRTDIKLVSDEKTIRKYCARPQLHAFKQFESVAAIHLLKTQLTLDRPLYAGSTILELSKSTYGERARLLFTDTDSLCYELTTNDVYADMLADADYFDTRDYPTDHPNYSTTNKKVLGKLKDETAGRPILELVGQQRRRRGSRGWSRSGTWSTTSTATVCWANTSTVTTWTPFAQQTTTVSSPSSSGRRPCRRPTTGGSSSATRRQHARTGTSGTPRINPRAVRTIALRTACIPIHRLYIYTQHCYITVYIACIA